MKIFYTVFLFLTLVVWGGPLSAITSMSPQDPAFLDNFNEQQKIAIHRFLNQELGKSTIENEKDVLVDAEALKQTYREYLNSWGNKFRLTLSLEEQNSNTSSVPVHQKDGLDCSIFSTALIKSFSKCKSKAHCANAVPITAEDIGTKGIIIKKPGHYCLNPSGGILYWKPKKNTNMITIDADNVILDLSQTTVVQRLRSNFASSAINILPDHQNITIHNGNFVGFTADVIKGNVVNQLFIENILITENNNRQVYIPSFDFASVNLQTCLNVILRNITVVDTTLDTPNEAIGSGILLLNTQNFLIEHCNVSNSRIFASTTSQFIGIATLLSHNGIIRKCNVANCTSTGIMPGFGYIFSENITSENCTANYNIGRQTTSGYYPQFSNFLQFIKCEANNNQSTCQDCHGFPYFISLNGYFHHCRASNNAATNPTGGFNEKATGFELLITSNCLVDNCFASNNRATNPIRHYAAGFANGSSTDVVFRKCVSIGNTAIGNFGRGVGFGPALDPRFFTSSTGTIWENCIAEGNFGDAASIGFDLFGQIGAILIGSKSQNHQGQGIGILSNGPHDQGNPVDVPCNVVPIIVLTENTANNILVKSNIVTNNAFGGIVDTTGANNVYIDNTVFNNGTNFLGPIFTTGTPIRDWTIQSAPSNANNNGVVGDKLDNLNITHPKRATRDWKGH